MLEIKSNITCTRCGKDILSCNCENSPRTKIEQLEKENAELSNSVTELTNSKTELEKENAELKAQIEKLKCCGNCKLHRHFHQDVTECALDYVSCTNCRKNHFSKWELAE